MNTDLINLSKALSYALRHKPESVGLTLDAQGWVSLNLLVDRLQEAHPTLTIAVVKTIVADNDKKRFQVSEDGLQIRAVQGHSTNQVAVKRLAKQPPAQLYHGTSARNEDSIRKQGLTPGKRHQVHLSSDIATAHEVGARRKDRVVIFTIDAAAMHARGYRFEQAENGVWLTETVPAWALKEA